MKHTYKAHVLGICGFLLAFAVGSGLAMLHPTADSPPTSVSAPAASTPEIDAGLGSRTEGGSDEPTKHYVRVSPSSWYSLEVPEGSGTPQPYADIDGGFFELPDARIDVEYWTRESKPHFMDYLKPGEVPLTCPSAARVAWIDGRRATVEQCELQHDVLGYKYIVSAGFGSLPVYDGERMRTGTFTIGVSYSRPDQEAFAERVVRSVQFSRKPPNKRVQRSARSGD